MKSKKLSNAERESLTKSLIRSAFKKEDEKILKMINDFGNELYAEFVQPHMKAIKMLEGFATCKSDSMTVKDPNYYRHIYPKLNEEKLFLSGSDLIPILTADKHKKEYNKLQKIFQYQDKKQEKLEQARSKTEAVLNSISSSKQLLERWPEAYELYKNMFPNAQLLPTIPRSEMNKLLGLKTIPLAG